MGGKSSSDNFITFTETSVHFNEIINIPKKNKLKVPHQSGSSFTSMLFQMSVVSVQSPARGQVTGRLSQKRLRKLLTTGRSAETERCVSHRRCLRFICRGCNKCMVSVFLNSDIKSVFFTSSSLVSSFTKAG